MVKLHNSIELQEAVKAEDLLFKLIVQLNKDFQLSAICKEFDENTSFKQLNKELAETLLHLIQFKYDDYLNLIYRIDIPEKELAKITNINLTDVVNQLVFLVLKREYQKVWLKLHYK